MSVTGIVQPDSGREVYVCHPADACAASLRTALQVGFGVFA